MSQNRADSRDHAEPKKLGFKGLLLFAVWLHDDVLPREPSPVRDLGVWDERMSFVVELGSTGDHRAELGDCWTRGPVKVS